MHLLALMLLEVAIAHVLSVLTFCLFLKKADFFVGGGQDEFVNHHAGSLVTGSLDRQTCRQTDKHTCRQT